MKPIDFDKLTEAARHVALNSYCPYSRYRVGAALLADNGMIYTGCNVENASYGLTLCAECSLVSHLVGTGGTRLVAVCTVAGDGEPIAPCGRCRQVLFEFGGAELLVDTNAGPVTLGELLPWAFGPEDVVTRRNEP